MADVNFDILYVNLVNPIPIPGGRRFLEFHKRLSHEFKIAYVLLFNDPYQRKTAEQILKKANIKSISIRVPISNTSGSFFHLYKGYLLIHLLRVMKKITKKYNFKIIHEEATPLPLFSKAFLHHKKTTLLTLHEVRGLKIGWYTLGFAGLIEGFSEKMLTKLGSLYDYIITVSFSTFDRIRKYLGLRPLLIPNGVDVDKFSPFPESSYRDNSRVFRIITVGRFVRHKGYFLLPWILKILNYIGKKALIKIIYTLVGSGPYKRKIVQYVSMLTNKLSNVEVIIKSNLTEEAYIEILRKNDLYLHLNPYMEGFGFSVAEAMSVGLPVVAFNIPGVNELVENDINGFLVRPFDLKEMALKIALLIENEDLRKRFGWKARKKIIRKYSIAKSVSKLKKLYNYILET